VPPIYGRTVTAPAAELDLGTLDTAVDVGLSLAMADPPPSDPIAACCSGELR
jgi:hypothetical protein